MVYIFYYYLKKLEILELEKNYAVRAFLFKLANKGHPS